MTTFYRNIILLIILTNAINGVAQQQNIPLNREFGLTNQKVFNAFGSNVHTSFLPISESFIDTISNSILSESEKENYLINLSKSSKKPRSFFGWMWRSFAYDNLLVVDTGKLYLTVDVLLNIENEPSSKDNSSQSLYKNTRGAIVRANVRNKFSFETRVYESQMVLPYYMDSIARLSGVIAGQGRWKNFKGNKGYDFSSSSANVSYTPNKHLNFQIGTGKNFVGDGYRSLLLSDVSFNYPFWKVIGTFGKNNQFQYTKLNGSLSSITRRERGSTAEALFARKTMSTHYFSWLTTKWLNIGLFESTMWQTEDSTGTKPLKWQQFNPIIGVNTATTGFGNVNHTVIGTNLKIKLPFKAILYNQFVYDGKSSNGDHRYGYQIGVKYFGIPGLTIQAEYNSVAPNTYSSDVSLQAYTNYNENLAHPSTSYFSEFVGIINYKYNRFFTQIKLNSLSKYSPIIKPTSLHNVIESRLDDQKVQNLQFHLGFIVNPKNNMSILFGINHRIENSLKRYDPFYTEYVYVSFRTSLRNLYNDL